MDRAEALWDPYGVTAAAKERPARWRLLSCSEGGGL